jgi:predicted aminopeptidase
MGNLLKLTNHVILILLLSGNSGCSFNSYYAQSIFGQLEILQKSKPIDELLRDKSLPLQLFQQLNLAQQLRQFSISDLDLPNNGSYRQYADIGREYVVWNVFASPELSLQQKHWCYLIVGCLSYRGYFSRDTAIQLASYIEEQHYDVYVGGVAAYSTLGWIADPVLNTMLNRDVIHLAKIMFHELAHQKIYIKDDTEFNEAFADTVALVGVERWLLKNGDKELFVKFGQNQDREDIFVDLVIRYRQQLDGIYKSEIPETEKRSAKIRILQQMVNEYRQIRDHWNNGVTYDSWFALGVNNAKLNAVITYREYLPGFRNLLSSVNNNLARFYKLVEELGKCPTEKRKYLLLTESTKFSC